MERIAKFSAVEGYYVQVGDKKKSIDSYIDYANNYIYFLKPWFLDIDVCPSVENVQEYLSDIISSAMAVNKSIDNYLYSFFLKIRNELPKNEDIFSLFNLSFDFSEEDKNIFDAKQKIKELNSELDISGDEPSLPDMSKLVWKIINSKKFEYCLGGGRKERDELISCFLKHAKNFNWDDEFSDRYDRELSEVENKLFDQHIEPSLDKYERGMKKAITEKLRKALFLAENTMQRIFVCCNFDGRKHCDKFLFPEEDFSKLKKEGRLIYNNELYIWCEKINKAPDEAYDFGRKCSPHDLKIFGCFDF